MVCDWWDCKYYSDCKNLLIYNGCKFPPCASCVRFDLCESCKNYVDCAGLITRYLPNMFRRLVREIRLGEDTEKTQQKIRKRTLGGQKRD